MMHLSLFRKQLPSPPLAHRAMALRVRFLKVLYYVSTFISIVLFMLNLAIAIKPVNYKQHCQIWFLPIRAKMAIMK
jgi:hypothetical protein